MCVFMFLGPKTTDPLICCSYHKILHATIYSISFDSTDTNTTEFAWPEELFVQCSIFGLTPSP